MNKVLHTYVNKLDSPSITVYFISKNADNSFSIFFMLIQKKFKEDNTVDISTFIVFLSMYFSSLFVLLEISTSNSPQVACAHSVKAIQSVAMSFSVNW